MKIGYKISVIVVVLVMLIFILPTPGMARTYQLKVGCVELAEAPNTLGWKTFEAYVETASNGQIQVDVYPASQLGSVEELTRSLMTGVAEVAQGDETITGLYEPMFVLSIPFLFSNEIVARKFFESPFFDDLSKGFTKATGVRILAAQTYGFRTFTNNVRPITSLEDMKGLKIRVQNNPVMIKFAQALGASPTTVPFGELYSALQQGVVDGQENPPGLIYDMKFYEVQKYLTLDQHTLAFNFYYARDAWFQQLPDDLKKVIYVGAKMGSDTEYGMRLYGNRVSMLQALKEKGMKINSLSSETLKSFKEAAQEPVLEWLKGKIGEEVVNGALSTVEEIEAQLAKEALYGKK